MRIKFGISGRTPYTTFEIFVRIVLILSTITGRTAAANFTQCRLNIENILTRNGSIDLDSNATIEQPKLYGFSQDPIYHGKLFGFRTSVAPRPLTLTRLGCGEACGYSPQLNDPITIFQILTTWVIPAIAFFSQFPYDARSDKKWKNLEALFNWVGSPAAALTTTLWNIQMIRECRLRYENFSASTREQAAIRDSVKDSMYILSCLNQYECARSKGDSFTARDTAILRGVLHPYIVDNDPEVPPELRVKLRNLNTHLAFQLRLQRRRGVWPLGFSLIWFLLAFVSSIVVAFDSSLGDNSTAHSLALGLLMSWLPVVVVATIIDRNPVSVTRCGVLLERWLYNINALFGGIPPTPQSSTTDTQRMTDSNTGTRTSLAPRSHSPTPTPAGTHPLLQVQGPRVPTEQWRPDEGTGVPKLKPFDIGEYVGQGRRLRYCAITDTILEQIKTTDIASIACPKPSAALEFKAKLTSRPKGWSGWYATWVLSYFIVTTAVFCAFTISFRTPTIGLGCRSFAYLIWWTFGSISWIILGARQEPESWLRRLSNVANFLSALVLFTTMLIQSLGGFNFCFCMTSVLGGSLYGGYIDFEDGAFYHRAYNVRTIWALATVFGTLVPGTVLTWLLRRFDSDKPIWKVNEELQVPIIDGVDLHWLT